MQENLDKSFYSACKIADIKSAEYYLRMGANIHVGEDQSLCLASWYGRMNVVRFLVENGAYINYDSVKLCIIGDHLHVLKFLIVNWRKRGEKIDYNRIFYIAVNNKRVKCARYIFNIGNVRNVDIELLNWSNIEVYQMIMCRQEITDQRVLKLCDMNCCEYLYLI